MNETATATAANDADRTARTVGTTVPEYRFVIGSEREYNTDKLRFE